MEHEIIDMLREDIREIKKDVKTILALKNKVYGIVFGVSAVVSLGFNYIFK